MSKEFEFFDIHRKIVELHLRLCLAQRITTRMVESLRLSLKCVLVSLLQNMQYNITNKSLDAIGVSQYIKCGLTINQYRLRKIIQIQGDKNGY